MTAEDACAPDFEPAYSLVDPCGVSDLVFPFLGQSLLVDASVGLPCPEDLRVLGEPSWAFRFGTLSGQACALKIWPYGPDIPTGLAVGDYRKLWGQWPPGRLAALVRARQLAAWVLHNRFCGVCGQAMALSPTESACECAGCGCKAYPRISPVAIGLIVKGDKILLARSPHFPPGMYSALAGFVEAGESVEDCLRREIREEAGIEIRNIRYFGSQPWPYPHSLMLGFVADYHSGELVAQEDEIEDINWFGFDALPVLPHPGSLAYRMIESVRAALLEKTRQP